MRVSTLIAASAVVAAWFVASPGAAQATPKYSIAAVSYGYTSASAYGGLSSDGRAVASVNDAAYNDVPLLYNGSSFQSLAPALGGNPGIASGINASGTVVGRYDPNVNGYSDTGYVYSSGGGLQAFATLVGGTFSPPSGINDNGQIVGTRDGHAILYTPGQGVTDLGTNTNLHPSNYYTSSEGNGINASGQVAGTVYKDAGSFNQVIRAFRSGSNGLTELGTLGGNESLASSINASGATVGLSTRINGDAHAFLYDTSMHDLGTLGGTYSSAFGVNDSNQVVGYSTLADGSTQDAFLYMGGTMYDLNSLIDPSYGTVDPSQPVSGVQLSGAIAINNRGDILATGTVYDPNGPFGDSSTGVFLLSVAVPEPATLAVLAVGVLGLAGVRRARKA